MIAAISLMRRREDVPLARFRRHWLDVHGPLVCRFPNLLHYVQCHVLDSPATNQAARALRIDGIPILLFRDDAARTSAHHSSEMAACNIDSQLFIGAVARIIAEQYDVVPVEEAGGRVRLIVLFPAGMADDDMQRQIDGLALLPGLRGLRRYRLLQQGRAPNSIIPHLAADVATVAQAWFDSLVDLECAAAELPAGRVAYFATEEHRLL